MASEEISDRIMENTNEDSGGRSSTDGNGKTDADILVKVQSLFGEPIFEALQSKKYFAVKADNLDLHLKITVCVIFLFHFEGGKSMTPTWQQEKLMPPYLQN